MPDPLWYALTECQLRKLLLVLEKPRKKPLTITLEEWAAMGLRLTKLVVARLRIEGGGELDWGDDYFPRRKLPPHQPCATQEDRIAELQRRDTDGESLFPPCESPAPDGSPAGFIRIDPT